MFKALLLKARDFLQELWYVVVSMNEKGYLLWYSHDGSWTLSESLDQIISIFEEKLNNPHI